MNKTIAVFVVLVVIMGIPSCAQTNVKSPVPKSCTPGDLFESYSAPSRCVATNKWEVFQNSLDRDQFPLGEAAEVGYEREEWKPDCGWAFRDVNKNWHCPYETATGRVVGCVPCSGKFAATESCKRWHDRCQRLVEIMKTHQTTESSRSDAPNPADKTQRFKYVCPDSFRVEWLGPHEEYDVPICMK